VPQKYFNYIFMKHRMHNSTFIPHHL